jgi:hypothetical protein
LAATLNLSQPRGADYAHPILMSTPSFESHRRACMCKCAKLILNIMAIQVVEFSREGYKIRKIFP